MDGMPPNNSWRNKYISRVLPDARAEREAAIEHRVVLVRQTTMQEIGGEVTLGNVIDAAVVRAKNKAIAARGEGAGNLFGDWDQHDATKTKVFEQFRAILVDLGISTDPHTPIMVELEEKWGTGYALDHE